MAFIFSTYGSHHVHDASSAVKYWTCNFLLLIRKHAALSWLFVALEMDEDLFVIGVDKVYAVAIRLPIPRGALNSLSVTDVRHFGSYLNSSRASFRNMWGMLTSIYLLRSTNLTNYVSLNSRTRCTRPATFSVKFECVHHRRLTLLVRWQFARVGWSVGQDTFRRVVHSDRAPWRFNDV